MGLPHINYFLYHNQGFFVSISILYLVDRWWCYHIFYLMWSFLFCLSCVSYSHNYFHVVSCLLYLCTQTRHLNFFVFFSWGQLLHKLIFYDFLTKRWWNGIFEACEVQLHYQLGTCCHWYNTSDSKGFGGWIWSWLFHMIIRLFATATVCVILTAGQVIGSRILAVWSASLLISPSISSYCVLVFNESVQTKIEGIDIVVESGLLYSSFTFFTSEGTCTPQNMDSTAYQISICLQAVKNVQVQLFAIHATSFMQSSNQKVMTQHTCTKHDCYIY